MARTSSSTPRISVNELALFMAHDFQARSAEGVDEAVAV